ncbi:hypothetical protein HBB16_07070 [Pseudonocardia sp. MCCB 268]|nr:hypothetical protein [Pseudonocardia cytotoxica]
MRTPAGWYDWRDELAAMDPRRPYSIYRALAGLSSRGTSSGAVAGAVPTQRGAADRAAALWTGEFTRRTQ